MKKKIHITLNELGVPFHLKGRDYIEAAIELILNEGRIEIIKELYPRLAKEFNTTPLRIERGIRTAIEETFSNSDPESINNVFGNTFLNKNRKLKNSNFLYGIAKHIQVYG